MQFYRPKGILAGFVWNAGGEEALPVLEAGEQWLPRNRPIPEHVNAGWEIYFQPMGGSVWKCGRHEFRVEAGGFYLAAPRVRHQLVFFEKEQTHFYFAVLPERCLPGGESPNWPAPFHTGPSGYALETPFRGLVRELALGDAGQREGIGCYAAALRLEIGRLLDPAKVASPANLHPAVARACEMMERHPSAPWRLDELASLACVSIPHLVSLFRRDIGQAPRQYLLRRRIERAEEMLRTTDRPVTAIAYDLGFSSSQHFARVFRKIRGRTPISSRK